MTTFWWITGGLLALIWVAKAIESVRGMAMLPDLTKPEWDDARPAAKGSEPRVTIVVPIRNEEKDLEEALTSLLYMDYGNYEVIAINDRSTDRTPEILARVKAAHPTAPLTILTVTELPDGWLGKNHAMWLGAKQGTGDWVLFTDGDIVFRPDTLRKAIAYAEQAKADHAVILPTMIMKTPGERMMISYFMSLFIFGYRAWKVHDPKSRDCIGAGAFNLIRRSCYEALGTFEAMRMAVVDDLRLGMEVKAKGYAQRAIIGRDLIRVHWVSGMWSVVTNLTKNLFAIFRYNWFVSVGAVAGMFFLTVMPYLGAILAPGWARLPFGIALFVILCMYINMHTRSDAKWYYFFTYPIACLLFSYAILRSAFLTWWRGAVVWRGTAYSLQEIRKLGM